MTSAHHSDAPGPDWPGAQRAYRGSRDVSVPDNGELMRRVDDVSGSLKEDLAEIKSSLSALLPREVYDARHTALVLRVERLETEQAKEAEQRRTLMRWVVGTMIVPVCLFIAQMWINAQGAGV